MSILVKIEEWKCQLEQAKEYDLYFDVNTVEEMIQTFDQQQAQIDLLITIVNGCEKIAEQIGDEWISNYIKDFKNEVINGIN